MREDLEVECGMEGNGGVFFSYLFLFVSHSSLLTPDHSLSLYYLDQKPNQNPESNLHPKTHAISIPLQSHRIPPNPVLSNPIQPIRTPANPNLHQNTHNSHPVETPSLSFSNLTSLVFDLHIRWWRLI